MKNRDYDYVALVYRKSDPWPIRHFCFMTDDSTTPRGDKEAFFKWYYEEYYQHEDDEVEFFDDLDQARDREECLEKISDAG